MTGRPRTRFAKALAGWLRYELETTGPATMPDLLDRVGYGDRSELSPQRVAVVNMAVRELMKGPVAIDPWTSELHYHAPGTSVPWTTRGTATAL
jgi:hypothetical protein